MLRIKEWKEKRMKKEWKKYPKRKTDIKKMKKEWKKISEKKNGYKKNEKRMKKIYPKRKMDIKKKWKKEKSDKKTDIQKNNIIVYMYDI